MYPLFCKSPCRGRVGAGRSDGDVEWSQKPDEFDVANVFRYAATFLACFLELYGNEFGVWDSAKVRGCWEGEA